MESLVQKEDKKKNVSDFLEFLGFMGDSFMVVRGYFYRLDKLNGLNKNVKAKDHCLDSLKFMEDLISGFSCTKKERKIIEKLENEMFVLKRYFDKNSLSKMVGLEGVPVSECLDSVYDISLILEIN